MNWYHVSCILLIVTTCPATIELPKNNTLTLGYMSFMLRDPSQLIIDITRHLARLVINNSTEPLPNHHLEFIYKEENGSASQAFVGALELCGIKVRDNETYVDIPFVLGPTISDSATAALTASKPFETIFLTSSAISQDLADRTLYPFFSRMLSMDVYQSIVAAELAYSIGWRTMGILTTTATFAASLADQFKATFEALGGRISVYVSFPARTSLSISSEVTLLKKAGVYAFFLPMHYEDFLIATPELDRQGMIGPPYAYIGGHPVFQRWDNPKLNGIITFTPSGNFSSPYYQEMVRQWNTWLPLEPNQLWNYTYSWDVQGHAPYAYDSVYVAAYVFRRYWDLENACLNNLSFPANFSEFFPAPGFNLNPCVDFFNLTQNQLLYKILRYVKFEGASGIVEFDDNHERLNSRWDIFNRQNNDWVKIGTADPGKSQITGTIIWPDGTANVPPDQFHPPIHSASLGDAFALRVFEAIDLILIFSMTVITLRFYNTRVIQFSFRPLLLTLLFGSFLVELVGILHSSKQTPSICTAKLWLFHIGFIFIIASLLLSLLRIYLVFNVDDYYYGLTLNQVVVGCGGLMLALDILLLIIWTGAYPFSIDSSDRCSSSGADTIFPPLAILKALYIFIAGYLASQVRKIPSHSDHKTSLALSTCNIGAICAIWLVAAELFGDDPSEAKVKITFENIVIIISQLLLIGIMFLPKLYGLYRERPQQSADAKYLEIPDLEALSKISRNKLTDLEIRSDKLRGDIIIAQQEVYAISEEVRYLTKTKGKKSNFYTEADLQDAKKTPIELNRLSRTPSVASFGREPSNAMLTRDCSSLLIVAETPHHNSGMADLFLNN